MRDVDVLISCASFAMRYHAFRSVREETRVRLHRNAKTTLHMRALLVDRIRHRRWTPATAASAAGVSVRNADKWPDHFAATWSLWEYGNQRDSIFAEYTCDTGN